MIHTNDHKVIKLFTVVIYKYFVHDRLFQPSLMFLSKARNLPKSVAPERCFTWTGSRLTHKYLTRLERFAKDKHSSLLGTFVNHRCKKFNNIGSRASVPLNEGKCISLPFIAVISVTVNVA
jgi:hypothetical protein